MIAKRGSGARTGSRKRGGAPAPPRPQVVPNRSNGVRLGEDVLRRSEERFRLLVDRVRDYAIFMLDPDGVIISWNEGARRIKGYTADEIIGQNFSRFYTPEDVKSGHPRRLLALAAQEGRVEEEGCRVRKDGTLFWADVVITALRDDRGRLRGFAKVTRDLTERRRNEEALRESEQRLRAIFDNSPSIIFLKDTKGRYLDCNPPFEQMVGHSKDEIVGKTDDEIMPEEQAAQYTANDQAVLKSGQPVKFEETSVHADGPRASIVAKFPLRDAGGKVYAIGGVVTDITERKRAEESMRQLAGRLFELQDEEQERLARELQGGVVQSLDRLRSQLNTVKTSGTVFDWKTSETLEESMTLTREVTKDVRTLAHLLYPRLLDEAGLTESLRWFATNFSQQSGIETILDISAGFGRLDRAVERGLFRILQECLTNVQQHAESRVARIKLTRDAKTVHLEVTDEGKGILEGVLDEGGATTMSGVGIRGMRERMRQLGGRLEIASGKGGTTVRATLPLPDAPPNE